MRKFVLMGITALVSAALFFIPVSATVVDSGTGAMDSLDGETTEVDTSVSTEAPEDVEVTEEDNADGHTEVRLMSDEELIGSTATIDDVDDYIEDKGGQIIHVVQKVCSYIDGIIFIVCLGMVIIGAIGNKKLLSTGGIGCLFCLIVYCAIYFGPALLEWFRAWSAPNL